MKKAILSLCLIFAAGALFAQYGDCGANDSRNPNHNSNYNHNYNYTPGPKAPKAEKVDYLLYPNPSSSYFQVDEKSIEKGKAREIRLFSTLGHEVGHYRLEKAQQYDISNLSAGVYVIRFYDYRDEIVASRLLQKGAAPGMH